MTLNYVTLTCDVYDGQGNCPTSGTATFTPSATLTDTTDHGLVAPIPVTVSFKASGVPVVKLLATDNAAPAPGGWGWNVTFSGTGLPSAFSFFLPYASGASQYLSSQAPTSSVVTMAAYLPLDYPTGAHSGYVWTSDSGGTGSWQAASAGMYVPVAAPQPSGDTTGAADTSALNTALAALAPRETLVLTVPGYYTNAPLSVPSGCGLSGSMPPGTASTPHITVASGFSGGAVVANAGWLSNSRTGDDGIEIANLFIDGQNGGSTGPFVSTNGHGIVLSAAHSRIHHCYVKNTSGAGIVWADFNSASQSVNAGTTQENYCYDNKVSNPGQWCIWVSNTSGSVGMTDSVISRCVVTDPSYGSYYRNGHGNPQINSSNNFPYEAIRLDNGAGWWVTENHAYWCPGGAYFLGTLYSTHVLNNTCDSWGTFPWSLVSGVFTAGVINGMSLHKVKCDINAAPAITGRAIPSFVSGNVLNTLEGLNSNGLYAAASGTSGSGCRFTFFDVTIDTLSVPAGATGHAELVFTGNAAHQNSVGGQSVASCTTTNSSATVTAAGGAFAGVQSGMSVTGTGIPASTYVGTVVTGGSDSVTLVQSDQTTAQNATASGTVTLTFPAPYSLAEKWTGTVASTVLNVAHSSNRATGSVVAQPTISTSNGAVISLLGEFGGVTVSGVPSSGQLPFATGAPTAAWRALAAGDLPAATTSTQGAVVLDGTAADIAPHGAQAAGAVGKAADSGHVHPADTFTLADYGLLAATCDPAVVGNSTGSVAGGTLFLVKLWVRAAATFSNLLFVVTTAGGGTTNGSFVGLYNSAGTLLTGSSDMASSVNSGTGIRTVAFTTPQALTAGTFVWAAMLVNLSSSAPSLRALATAAASSNFSLTASTLRFAVNGTGLTTPSSLPTPLTVASNTGTGSAPFLFGIT